MAATAMQKMKDTVAAGIASLLVVALCVGCRVSTQSGKGKDVSIDTPLGGMQVKSDPSHVLDRIGLPQYPNSSIVAKKPDSDDDRSADVDMSFGGFHLRVMTVGLQTQDGEPAVEAFYRKALSRYSDVIACRGHEAVGRPAKTGMGLTCSEDEKDRHIRVGKGEGESGDDELQLKAGSHSRQHIVSIKPQDGGTRLQLIALDLPNGGDKD